MLQETPADEPASNAPGWMFTLNLYRAVELTTHA